jgi:hypothetical protein
MDNFEDNFEDNEEDNINEYDKFMDFCFLVHRDLKKFINENALPLLENLDISDFKTFVDEF